MALEDELAVLRTVLDAARDIFTDHDLWVGHVPDYLDRLDEAIAAYDATQGKQEQAVT